jgi:hypothetical protein
MSPSPKLSKLDKLYGRKPGKRISNEKLLKQITDAMGNKYEFYNGLQDDILRLYGPVYPGIKTNELDESLVRPHATTYITNWMRSIRMDDHPHLIMVEKVVDDFMKYNQTNSHGDVFVPPHLTMPPIPPIEPSIEYETVHVPPKQNALRRILNTINNLKRKETASPYEYGNAIGIGGKSKKQQRKTKAKKTHRKRTQRK